MPDKEDDIFERVAELETQVYRLSAIIQFHQLHKIENKYKKAFPREKEYPFFTAEGFNADLPRVVELGGALGVNFTGINPPKNPEELNQAKERMRCYEKLSKSIKPPSSVESPIAS